MFVCVILNIVGFFEYCEKRYVRTKCHVYNDSDNKRSSYVFMDKNKCSFCPVFMVQDVSLFLYENTIKDTKHNMCKVCVSRYRE